MRSHVDWCINHQNTSPNDQNTDSQICLSENADGGTDCDIVRCGKYRQSVDCSDHKAHCSLDFLNEEWEEEEYTQCLNEQMATV